GAVCAVVTMHHVGPPEPCHPGCFPAGTLVHTPEGARAIENIRAGDKVTSVAADGSTSVIKVQSVFTTPNRLLNVQTDGGTLLTTPTQPLCLADGGFRAAGELKPGDRMVRWQDG